MSRRFVPLLLILPALLLFWKLDYAPFWNPDEGRYAAASLEMAYPFDGSPSDWVIPRLNTLARLNKPPLVYWGAGSLFRAFGPSEITGRLPSALAAFGVAIILYLWGSRAFGRRAGLCGAFVWVTMMFPFAMARVLNTDMLLTFAIALGTFGIWLTFWSREGEEKSAKLFWAGSLAGGVGMGLALLAKGPVGLLIPLVTAFVYIIFSNGWRRAPWSAIPILLIVALAVGTPWFAAAQAKRSDFLQIFLWEENFGRFSGKDEFHKKTPIYFYLPVLLLGMLPWTGFAPAAFTQWTRSVAESRARLFLFVYAGFIVAFFSISGTKLISYVLPAFPALALLVGAAVSRWEWQPVKLRWTAIGFTVFLFLLLIVLGSKFLLDGKVLPPEIALPYLLTMGAVLLATGAGLLLTLRRPEAKKVVATLGVGSAALFVVLLGLAGNISRYEDASNVFKALAPVLRLGDAVVGYDNFKPASIFYTRRPVYFLGFKNTSGYRENELATSPYFPGYVRVKLHEKPVQAEVDTLIQLLKDKPRAFILTEEPLELPTTPGTPKIYLWGENNDEYLYSNTPKPADWTFHAVAPRAKK